MKSNELKMKKFLIITAAFLALSGVRSAKAWSGFTHAYSVYIAEQNLTPEAKKMCRHYLQHTLAYYASWMDHWKGADAFKSVNARHSVMTTADGKGIDFTFDEYGKPYGVTPGECMGYLRDAMAELGEGKYKNLPDSLVRQRLINMVHYVADMHCPAHVNFPKDKYPQFVNNKPIKMLNGKMDTFHTFWDCLPQQGRRSWLIEDCAKNLNKVSRKQAKAWQSGTLEDWGRDIAEAGYIAYDMFVNKSDVRELTPEEMDKAMALVEKMAVMSAYRLAQVLNTIFKY